MWNHLTKCKRKRNISGLFGHDKMMNVSLKLQKFKVKWKWDKHKPEATPKCAGVLY